MAKRLSLIKESTETSEQLEERKAELMAKKWEVANDHVDSWLSEGNKIGLYDTSMYDETFYEVFVIF